MQPKTSLMPFDPPVSKLGRAWYTALQPMLVRHPDPEAHAELWLRDEGSHVLTQDWNLECVGAAALEVVCSNVRDSCTMDKRLFKLTVATTRLSFFPGPALARMWLTCAWAGYVMHETLELSSINGDLNHRVIDPHLSNVCGQEDYAHDRALRNGFPAELNPESMQRTFEVCMSREAALSLIMKYSAEMVVF